jgi:DNA mismatch repair protein MutS
MAVNNKKTIIDEYFDYLTFYEEKYGKNVLVFIQIGSFYEIYEVVNSEEKIGKAGVVAELLNFQLTRKNKSIPEIDRGNPLLCGVPLNSFKRHLDTLSKLNKYTIIVISQVSEPPEPKREVTEIISPGTYLESYTYDVNNLMSINIEKEFDNSISIGCSLIDLTTGKNYIMEFYSSMLDEESSFDDIVRYIKASTPKEIIINYSSELEFLTKENKLNFLFENNKKDLVRRLEIENIPYHFNKIDNNESPIKKISYQNELLGEIFKEKISEEKTCLSPIEYLELERMQIGTLSYISLLIFAYEHNENIIKNIQKPEIIEKSKNLILATNTINQLNLISNNNLDLNEDNSSLKSIFDVINRTKTSIGRRKLKYNLLNPIISKQELNNRYNKIETIKKGLFFEKFDGYLEEISDIERLHRKIALKTISPVDFVILHNSYVSILNLVNITHNIEEFKYLLSISEVESIINYYEKRFNLDEMNKYLLNDIKGSFLKIGVSEEIDDLQKSIDINMLKLNEYLDYFNGDAKIESNDRDGFYIIIPNGRLKNLLENKMQNNYSLEKVEEIKSTFTFLKQTNQTKITNEKIEQLSNAIIALNEKMKVVMKNYFISFLETFYLTNEKTLRRMVNFIEDLDVSSSNAKVAIENNYNRPIIIDRKHEKKENNNNLLLSKSSFLDIKEVRHPLIEKISEDVEYVTNNVVLDNENDQMGMLIYGTNASGKSSLMKAIGIAVIMAQAGMFVAAKEMEYNIFHSVFTRIDGGDNIFKGLSTFAVEMLELRNILKRSDEYSLVLGDEISHGTESISALAIVASSIISLHQKNVKFIFATHLHELSKMERIKALNGVNHYHLKVLFNEELEKLVFDRKLELGAGNAIYGLEVARSFNMDPIFIKNAKDIRKEIIGQTKLDLLINEPKVSKYNNKVYVTKCNICDSDINNQLDTHHIKEQNTFVKYDKNKNKKSNLIVLCQKCHNKVHNNEIIINGFQMTSEGIELSFEEKN